MRHIGKLTLLALTIPSQLIAGGAAVIESRSEAPAMTSETELAWRDGGPLRMGSAGDQGYMIFRDGAAYTVMEDDGETHVLQLTGTSDTTPGAGQGGSAGANSFGTIDAVEATGSRETVAGVEGEIYRVTVILGDGETVTQEWVLTDDSLVTEMTDAYLGSLDAMFGVRNAESALSRMQAALPEDRRGLLRADEGFRLISISPDEPAPELFELPAEPVSLQEMIEGMRGQ